MIRTSIALACVAASALSVNAMEMSTSVNNAILVDVTYDEILFEKNSDQSIPPASMSKIYTHMMLFDAIKEGRTSLEDTFEVSEKAWRMPGSRTFLDVGSEVSVQNLMLGLAVQSGNDAAVAIAEGLFGTQERFADFTTRRLQEIGAENTNVVNASGLPHEDHRTTVEDLSIAAEYIVENHPEHFWIFSEKEYTWNDIYQQNRNPLLGWGGVDGMKTGWTTEAGYGLIASAERDGRRLIGVIAGAKTPDERAKEMRALLDWGFHEFEVIEPCSNQSFDVAVANAVVDTEKVVTKTRCPLLVERGTKVGDEIKVEATLTEPIVAPVERDTLVGIAVVSRDGEKLAQADLTTSSDIPALTFLQRVKLSIGLSVD